MKREIDIKKVRRAAFTPNLRSVDEEARTIEFVASTETPDRYGDVIRVAGWDTEAYEKNPIFLWAHQSRELPIGRTIKLTVEKSPKPALVHVVQFTDAKENPLGVQAFNLYKGGFLNAVSVGFKPTKRPKAIEDEDGNFMGWEFTDQELLELSAVPVPANPEALARGLDSGKLTKDMIDVFFNVEGEESKVKEEKGMKSQLKEVLDRLVKTNENVEELAAAAVRKEELVEHNALIVEMKTCLSVLVETIKALAEASVTRESVSEIAPAVESIRQRVEKIATSMAKSESVSDLAPKFEELRSQSSKLLAAIPAKQDLKDVSVRLDGARDAISALSATVAKESELSKLAAATAELGGRFKIFLEGAAREDSVIELHDTVEEARSVLGAAIEKLVSKIEFEVLSEKVDELVRQNGVFLERLAELTLLVRQHKDDKSQAERMVCPYTDDPIASSGTAWDAAAEMAKVMSPMGWKHMSTVIVGDAANKTSYKLPHHRGGGNFAIVPDGVRAALGRLEQTSMPATDRSGARSHLVRHQAKISAQAGIELDVESFEAILATLGDAYRLAEVTGNKVFAESVEREIQAHIASVVPGDKKEESASSDPLSELFLAKK